MKEWIARIAFTLVFFINVMCALQFLVDPASYVGAYQLEGEGAEAAIRGYGVVFLMWNATYPIFIAKPTGFKVLGAIILLQQAIGFLGESLIFVTLPEAGTEMLASSVLRFMAFDGAGLLVMLAAYLFLIAGSKSSPKAAAS